MRNLLIVATAATIVAAAPLEAAAAPKPVAVPAVELSRVPMREPGVRGGRFVVASSGGPRTFNPMMANETSSADVTDRLFAGLAEFDNHTQLYRPSLAREWTLGPDGRTVTWRLRRGARFSDGRPITSADVVFSLAVACDTALGAPVGQALIVAGRPIEVTAPDPYTIVTRAAEPFALLVPSVASVRILPRHVLEPAWRAGRFASAYSVGTPPESLVTSGAWKLQSFAAGEKTVLAPNPFWIGVDARGQRLPYLDQLVLLILPDANAAALKFAANDGELDALENVRPEDHQRFAADQARGHYTLYDLGPSLTSNFFWFNLNLAGAAGGSAGAEARRPGDPMAGAVPYAWFSNRDFRRAISRAIDRDAMIRGVFFGRGARNWSVITAGNHAFSDPATPAWDYDPAAARQLLAGEGFADRDRDSVLEDARGNPVSFRLEVGANSAVRVQLANFVRDDLARVGIRCQLVPTDFNALVGKIQESHDYQAILGGLAGVIPPDPAAGASFYLSSGSTHFWNARQGRPATAAEAQLDSLFGALARSSDLATRQRLSAQMDRIVADECWLVWLPIPTVEAAVRDRIGNLEPSGFRPRLLWNSETLFVRPAAKH